MKTLLMIAFHFPPQAGSSGIQRTLGFARHLPMHGWRPVILSVDPRAYPETRGDQLDEIPDEVPVHRAWALDSARHLAWRGRYLGRLARPDRWWTWRWAAVRDGLRLIDQYRPAALWSTYPIPTAHVIGARLQRYSGLPWLADFRDPMAQDDYPADPVTHSQYVSIEKAAFAQARSCVMTTPGAAALYGARYPAHRDKIAVIENGYDERVFRTPPESTPLRPGCLTLLHSGIVYPSERDPGPLFQALRRLKESGQVRSGEVCLRFRAPVHEALLRDLTATHGLGDFIEILPPLPYAKAIDEMRRADALLLMQAANCNAQIPAKFYEYLRAGRPILSLVAPEGDTAAAVRTAGCEPPVAIDDADAIAGHLPGYLARLRAGTLAPVDSVTVRAAERGERARELARLLDGVCD